MRLAVRETLIGFRRAPLLSVLSITTIAFSLFAFGLFSLVALNIRNTLQHRRVAGRDPRVRGRRRPRGQHRAAMETIAAYPEVHARRVHLARG